MLTAFKDEGLDVAAIFYEHELDAMIREAEEATAVPPEEFATYDETLETQNKCPK